jgi:hypothetical protein
MGELKKENDAELGDSFQIIRIGYRADEEKDEAWAKKAKAEYSSEDWDREFELKPVGIQDVRPVFGDYKKERHEDESLVWRPSVGRQIVRGWDFGKVHPACEIMQVNGLEKNFIGEIAPDNIMEEQFVQMVLAYCQQNYRNCTFTDWIDISGRNEDRWGNSSIKTLKSYGIAPRGKDQGVEDGILQMNKEIVLTVGGRPYIMVNPKACPRLAAAMRGGYKRNKKGEIIKDGIHDHYVDAARYAIMGTTFVKGKSWDQVRDKLKAQYGKFPKQGRDIRR